MCYLPHTSCYYSIIFTFLDLSLLPLLYFFVIGPCHILSLVYMPVYLPVHSIPIPPSMHVCIMVDFDFKLESGLLFAFDSGSRC
ncbi:uncharacterized protein BDW47DRAFT_28673 [Aspergillus candidus]|uniref:Uncharacterized protein n=1 Tax=Aspergillus candidus TaxID=41067 RepID=A0A2I2FCM5_ASPCN|nr:hypothetical protein BDW47DRAFT_28673 [Aspergillus candidus]PLB38385.1 hypothetical protein BDW47DRAFT_28673 [Aspergillus candidus]